MNKKEKISLGYFIAVENISFTQAKLSDCVYIVEIKTCVYISNGEKIFLAN